MINCEVYETVLRICGQKANACLVPNPNAFLALDDPPVDRWSDDTCKNPRGCIAGYDGVKIFADMLLHHACRDYLPHLPLDLTRRLFLNVAMLGDSRDLVGGIRFRFARNDRLY